MIDSDSKLKLGLVYLYTGGGKGKTSAALGTALRALSHGWTVSWVAFYKQESWNLSELTFGKLLQSSAKNRWHMYLLGNGFYIQQPEEIVASSQQKIKVASTTTQVKVIDTHNQEQHQQAAQATLQKAAELLGNTTPPDVLVIDEVCNAIADGLIEEEAVLQLLKQRKTTHLVLTGRQASARLIAAADLVTEMKKVKHPYDSGVLAVKGLDY